MSTLIQYEYDIFLSYNHADEAWTANLAECLERENWSAQGRNLRVFFAPWDILPGQLIPKRIEDAIPKSRRFGLIMSPDAMASAWVELERLVRTYIEISDIGERLIPIYRKKCDLPALLKPILYIDFRDEAKFEEGYQILLAVIKDEPLPRRSHKPSDTSSSSIHSTPDKFIDISATSRDGAFNTLIKRLKGLRQLEQEDLIGESLKQKYADRAMDEWFEQTIEDNSNE